ncbi:MAG: ATP-dependent Clp protease proteolytic subunit [Bacteroides sp.]|nr:MAG: ATP-dependent Clp protease proteolytic subunit [Bacteroides sp.]
MNQKNEFIFLQDKIDNVFLKNRKIFIWGTINDVLAESVIKKILYLNYENKDNDIILLINSVGGSIVSGLAIYDIIKSINNKISTVCMGLCASMGSILLSSGNKGNRYIYKYGKVMIHQPLGGISGTSSDIEIQVKEIIKSKNIANEILSINCNKPINKINRDCDRDYWMNSEEAKKYGIVDHII